MLLTKGMKKGIQIKMHSAISRECYLGLGSNLHDPKRQIQNAYRILGARPEFNVCACSGLYSSKAMTADNKQQPDYVNAVVRLQTWLDPYQLLKLTQIIEQHMGRCHSPLRWRARIIDLDILLMGGLHIQDSQLTLPHPQLLRRPFVLYPLAEIAPQLILSNDKCTASWAAEIKDHWCTRRLSDLDGPHTDQKHDIVPTTVEPH